MKFHSAHAGQALKTLQVLQVSALSEQLHRSLINAEHYVCTARKGLSEKAVTAAWLKASLAPAALSPALATAT